MNEQQLNEIIARLRAALEMIIDPENWSENWFDPGVVKLAVDAIEGGVQSACKWEHDLDWETDVWETSCGDAVVFDEGEPKEHGYKFCHYCGKPIEFVENDKGGEG